MEIEKLPASGATKRNLQLQVEDKIQAAEQKGSPRPKRVSWSRRSSEPMDENSDTEPANTPFTITSLKQCAKASSSAQAAALIRDSLNKSDSLTPSKITARIEATELPESLDKLLSEQQLHRLKQIQFEHLRQERKKKALELIASIEKNECV